MCHLLVNDDYAAHSPKTINFFLFSFFNLVQTNNMRHIGCCHSFGGQKIMQSSLRG